MARRRRKKTKPIIAPKTLKKIFWISFAAALTAAALSTFEPWIPEDGSDVPRTKFLICSRGPETRVVDKQFRGEGCIGSAKIQVYRYSCGKAREVQSKTQEFFREIIKIARNRCKAICQARGPKCKATFIPPPKCGFSVPPHRAEAMGEQAGCHFACDGKAFTYCSMYHAGYLQADEEQLKRQPPNCRCSRKY